MTTIGILALQGGFARHAEHLTALNVPWKYIRQPSELIDVQGLIIPGGESTALLKLMATMAWDFVIKQFYSQGHWIFGTCAGTILLAQSVTPKQNSLGLIDIEVARNAYGRQLQSFIGEVKPEDAILGSNPIECVFIRAPKIRKTGSKVKVLLKYQGEPILVQQGNIYAATFHPELSNDYRIHSIFIEACSSRLKS